MGRGMVAGMGEGNDDSLSSFPGRFGGNQAIYRDPVAAWARGKQGRGMGVWMPRMLKLKVGQ
jgi:hypothetical protein